MRKLIAIYIACVFICLVGMLASGFMLVKYVIDRGGLKPAIETIWCGKEKCLENK